MAVVGYWPLDDAPGSRRAVSGISGGTSLIARPNVALGITPTAEFTPFAWRRGTLHQWLPPCLQAEAGGDQQGGKFDGGRMARTGVAGEWALDFLYRATAEPGDNTNLPIGSAHFLRQTDGIEWHLSFDPSTETASVSAFDADGVLLGGNGSISTGPPLGTSLVHDGDVKYIRLSVVDGGGGQGNWLLRVNTVIIGSGIIPMGGPLQAPDRYESNWLRIDLQDETLPFHIGQVTVWDNPPLSVFNVEQIILGHQGETPLERIRRVCEEDSIPFAGFGSLAIHEHATALGPQQTDTFLGILRDAERTSAGGVLYELAGGLAYATLEQRYNQTLVLEFDIADEPRLSESPEPIDDDLLLTNQITVTKALTGEVARRSDADSITASGVQPRDLQVNTAGEGQLADIAAWLLGVGLGTQDEYRWPQLNLDLARNPELIPAWLDFRLGGRVQVAGMFSTQLPGHVVDVLAEGWSETVRSLGGGRVQWQITLNTVPARPFTVGVWGEEGTTPDPDAPQRYSPDDSRTTASFDAGTDTALSVEDQRGGTDLLSQTADFPLDILVSGVRLRVTAVGAPAGAVQVLTVEQAPVNGVSKTVPSGSSVELYQPARYAL